MESMLGSGMWTSETSKPTSNDTSSLKATSPNPSQIVLPTRDQAFKSEPVEAFLIQTRTAVWTEVWYLMGGRAFQNGGGISEWPIGT